MSGSIGTGKSTLQSQLQPFKCLPHPSCLQEDLIKSGMHSPVHVSAASLDAGSNDRVTADIILAEYEATFEHCEGLNEEHPAADKIAMLKVGFSLLAQAHSSLRQGMSIVH